MRPAAATNPNKRFEHPASVDDGFVDWSTFLPEMLVEIFWHLKLADRNRVALVCSSWRSAVYVPVLWNKLTVGVRARNLEKRVALLSLVERGVRRVRVWTDERAGRRAGIATQIGRLVESMPDIQYLDVSGCQWPMTGNSLARAIRSTPLDGLTSLFMENLPPTTGKWLNVVAASCPHLERVSLAGSLRVATDVEWPTALRRLARLDWLDLSRCPAVNADSIRLLVSTTSGPPSPLQTLRLNACDELTDEAVSCIVDALPQLKTLLLWRCSRLTENAARCLSTTRLEQLWILTYSNGNDSDLFRTLTDRGRGSLIKHIRAISTGSYMNVESARLLADMYSRGKCSNLSALGIASSTINDEGLKAVATIATLKHLGFGNCVEITSVGIGYLASGRLSRLRRLEIFECLGVTDWFDADSEHDLSSLEQLVIYNVPVNDDGIQKVVRGSPRLKWIALGNCDNITGRSLIHIAVGLPCLEDIHLNLPCGSYAAESNRTQIGGTALGKLLRLPLLRHVSLAPHLRQVFGGMIASRRPDIQINTAFELF